MSDIPSGEFSVFRVIGSVCAIGLVVTAILLGGAPDIFISMPSFLLVVGLTFAMLIGLYGLEASYFWHDAVRVILFQKVPPNPRYAAIARSGSRFAVASGAVGSLMGVIQMLTTLDDPSKIGGGLAVALLTALYGLALSEFVFGFLQTAYSDPTDGSSSPATVPARNLGIPVAIIGLILATFLVLIISFSVLDVDRVPSKWGGDVTPFNPYDLPVDPNTATSP